MMQRYQEALLLYDELDIFINDRNLPSSPLVLLDEDLPTRPLGLFACEEKGFVIRKKIASGTISKFSLLNYIFWRQIFLLSNLPSKWKELIPVVTKYIANIKMKGLAFNDLYFQMFCYSLSDAILVTLLSIKQNYASSRSSKWIHYLDQTELFMTGLMIHYVRHSMRFLNVSVSSWSILHPIYSS